MTPLSSDSTFLTVSKPLRCFPMAFSFFWRSLLPHIGYGLTITNSWTQNNASSSHNNKSQFHNWQLLHLNEVFSGKEPRQEIYKIGRFGDMGAESVSETSDFINFLAPLSARGNFTEFCRRESFKTRKPLHHFNKLNFVTVFSKYNRIPKCHFITVPFTSYTNKSNRTEEYCLYVIWIYSLRFAAVPT